LQQVQRSPRAKRQVLHDTAGRSHCTRAGALVYFETEREALEFLAEIDDIVLH
jgi:hypothetical protein